MNLSIISIKRKRYFLLITILSFAINSFAQNVGCTDTNAVNYNVNAHINDGSCTYDPLFLKPEKIIETLPQVINETSGLIYFNGGLWTHNDSGGDARIYKFSPETGEILQFIDIEGVKNHDIEDITQDEHYIYVGDFGNNWGNRKNLQIYKIQKSNIPITNDTNLTAEIISFSYNDQLSFERKNRKNDYDCEAFISLDNHLYLFSKNWATEITKCYRLPKQAGDYKLEILDTFDVRGLITGADFDSTQHRLVLIGYENFVPFIWTIWDFSEDQFFSGHKKRADFAYINGAQTEGVCFKNPNEVYISCEASYYPQGLYQVNLSQIIDTKETHEVFQKFQIELNPNPDEKNIHIAIKGLSNILFTVEIYNLRWEQINQFSFMEEAVNDTVQINIPIQNMGRGIYFVKVRQGKNRSFQKMFINQ